MLLSDSIRYLKGVGEQRAKMLYRLDIYRIEDILYYYPRDYEDRTVIQSIASIQLNDTNTIQGTIMTTPQNIKKGRLILTKFRIKDDTGQLYVIWYGQPYMKNNFKLGEKYIFTGKVELKYGQVQMASPEYEQIESGGQVKDIGIVPIYSLTQKLSQKVIRQMIRCALEAAGNQLQEYIPQWIRKEYILADRNFSIQNIHFPETKDHFFIARKRLVFEEFFLLQFGLLQLKELYQNSSEGIVFHDVPEIQDFIQSLPFKLTNAQKKVFEEISKDMHSTKVMNRLVQGDVGSGKTMVATLAMLMAVKNGYQACMMAPTEVLATQHYDGIKILMEQYGIECALLVGSLTKKQKNEVLEQIKDGKIDIVLGTHALIQETVLFNKLGLVITDEQHRFGVRQRMSLSQKGKNPDVLIMTATPIPRTLALILYGDLDISIVDELPPGRQKIDTYCVKTSYRQRLYEFIKKEVNNGRQAYIICPMVEESETEDLQSVLSYTEELKEQVFRKYHIEYLHGKMKPKEKNKIMGQFADGSIQILVSTTVVEVGVNVPNATIMVIENAERFGLAQLHQLRGRVGRGIYKSYCILVSDSNNHVTKERMKVMSQSNDGFEISEVDLKLRGPGDFFGTKQHGLPDLRIANIYKDMPLLKSAQKAAFALLKKDPFLTDQEHQRLKCRIQSIFKNEKTQLPL